MGNDIGILTGNIDSKILNIHTAFLGKVLSVNGSSARVQPLTMYKAVGGKAKQQSPVSAVVPSNIKYNTETITYRISDTETETKAVLVPSSLSVGDIVYVGICERDISHAKNGKIAEATNRHHNINDGVILCVVR